MSGVSALSSSNSSSELKMNYMKLLTTQLSHQNPLDPMKNEQMTQQLTNLSQLEQMENLNTNFRSMLQSSQLTDAAKMIGMNVGFFPKNDDGTTAQEMTKEQVLGVSVKDGKVLFETQNHTVGYDDVVHVLYPEYSQAPQ